MKLTPIDRAVLSVAQFDARLSHAEIATTLNLSASKVRYAIEKLEGQSLISPHLRVNLQRLGLKQFLLWCRLSHRAPDKFAEVVEFLRQRPNVAWLGTFCGDYDLALEVYCQNNVEVPQIFSALQQQCGSVISHVAILQETYWVTFKKKHLYIDQKASSSGEVLFDGSGTFVPDRVDLQLIELLSRSPLAPISMLAQKVGIPAQTAAFRINRLSHNRALLGCAYSLNHPELGLAAFSVLLRFSFVTDTLEKQLRRFCTEHPHIVGFGRYFGEWDFQIYTECSSTRELYSLRLALLAHFGSQIENSSVLPLDRVYKSHLGIFEYFEFASHEGKPKKVAN